jgi:hypothetical protein
MIGVRGGCQDKISEGVADEDTFSLGAMAAENEAAFDVCDLLRCVQPND